MPEKKSAGSSEEIIGEAPKELETEELDEAHGGGLRPGAGVFTTVTGRSDLFNKLRRGVAGETIYGGIGDFNDLPLKRR